MPKPTKRKGAGRSTTTTSSSSNVTSNTSPKDIPPPFAPVPTELRDFADTLAPDHIYIVSIDRHDKGFKRRLFQVPLLLNIFLLTCVLYRVATGAPTYFNIAIATLGYDSPERVSTRDTSVSELVEVGVWRAAMFLGDFLLVRFLGMWPWNFFLGRRILSAEREAGPVSWRRAVTFREEEVVVRRSRRWDAAVFHSQRAGSNDEENIVDAFLRQGMLAKDFRDRLAPAVSKTWIEQKTGYQMLDQSWDLYFSGMIVAHALIDDGVNKLEDYRTQVIVHSTAAGWVVWDVTKDYELPNVDSGTSTSTNGSASSADRWEGLHQALNKIGKEDLFYRLIEVIQSETSQPGPFTAERQHRTVRKIREEFDEQKVDFDAFWKDLRGLESMPGLEVTSKS